MVGTVEIEEDIKELMQLCFCFRERQGCFFNPDIQEEPISSQSKSKNGLML